MKNARTLFKFVAGLSVAASLTLASGAWAQQPAGPAVKAQPTPAQLEDAKKKYEVGIKLYDEGAFDAARVQFERAYSIAPSYKILYNIGLVYKQLNEFAGSLEALEKYLAEGGAEVPKERLEEVTKLITSLKGIIASAKVTVSEPDAEISVDDKVIGKSPLAKPVLLNPGRRKISAKKEGKLPEAKVIEVASGDNVNVDLVMSEATTINVNKSDWKPVVGWIVTGAFVVGAGVTTFLTASASSDLDKQKGEFGGPTSQNATDKAAALEDKRSSMKTFALVSDILWAGSIIAGGLSLYWTLTSGSGDEEKKKETAPPPAGAKAASNVKVRFVPGLMGGGLVGTF